MKQFLFALLAIFYGLNINAQTGLKKVYDEAINPIEQIDHALVKAKSEGKFVICQVGGNWCPWCLRFADFITNDSTISKVIHIQDSSFLEEGQGYNQEKVLRFFKGWTPDAVKNK